MKYDKKSVGLISALWAGLALGTPSGLDSLPSVVVIPNYKGRPLPVELHAARRPASERTDR